MQPPDAESPAPPPPPPPPPPPVGYPPPYYYPPGSGYHAAKPRASSEAVAALVCGIAAWFCFPMGFLAVYLGARARQQARDNPELGGGEQLALAGMIMGGVLGGLQALVFLLYIVIFGAAFGFSYFHHP